MRKKEYCRTLGKKNEIIVSLDNIKFTDRTPLNKFLQNFCNDYENDSTTLLYRFEIPVSECINSLSIMHELGYNAAKLFPGYNGVAAFITENNLLYSLK